MTIRREPLTRHATIPPVNATPIPIPFLGVDYLCPAAFTDIEIPPWDSLHGIHELVAAPAHGPAGATLPAGTYRIRAAPPGTGWCSTRVRACSDSPRASSRLPGGA
jgi:hypothetical protein